MKNFYAILLVAAIIMLIPLGSYAQNAAPAPAPAPPPAQAPSVVPPPPDFPDYIVTPREDLNNFDLSTMSESDDIDYRDGVGTLGTSERRESNIDVNAELKRRKMEREKAKQEAEQAENQASLQQQQVQQPKSSPPELKSSAAGKITPGVRGGLFMWKDKNGVLNATNNLGQVPIEYQMQAIQNSGGTININKGEDNE